MKRKEFQEIVNDVIGTVKTGRGKKAVYTGKEALEVSWCSGGMTGGSCWDDGNDVRYYPVDASPEEDFYELDEILEKVCPNITYLQFRNLERLITQDSRTEDDYYGNYSVYAIKRLKVDDLWNFLVENGYGE